MKRNTASLNARDLLDSGKLHFSKLEFATIVGRSTRQVERHLQRGDVRRCSPPGKKVQIAREDTLDFRDRMRRGLV